MPFSKSIAFASYGRNHQLQNAFATKDRHLDARYHHQKEQRIKNKGQRWLFFTQGNSMESLWIHTSIVEMETIMHSDVAFGRYVPAV